MDDFQALAAFVALGNDIRFTVFKLLAVCGPEGLPAGVIAERVCLKPTAISFHLASMTTAGILNQRRMRRNLFYSINEMTVAGMASFLLATGTQAQAAIYSAMGGVDKIIVSALPLVVATAGRALAVTERVGCKENGITASAVHALAVDRLGEQAGDVADNGACQVLG